MKLCFIYIIGLFVLVLPAIGNAQNGAMHSLWHDGSKIVTPRECESCHHKEYALWMGTAHARHAKVDDNYDTAEYIKSRMGVLSMNSNSLCVKCHYTGMGVGERTVAITGVSCESCHGPAKDWLDLHNTIRPNENEAERETRRKLSIAKGMVRPTELYQLASSCFECHTVPEEDLVNRGGHNTGTRDFELLSAMEEIRHNFLHAGFAAGNVENSAPNMYRRRIIFVLGRMMDVEFSLRGLAESTTDGRYRKAMRKRLYDAVVRLDALCKIEYFPEVAGLLAEIEKLGEGGSYGEASGLADRLCNVAKRFSIAADARSLEGVDKLLLSQNSPK